MNAMTTHDDNTYRIDISRKSLSVMLAKAGIHNYCNMDALRRPNGSRVCGNDKHDPWSTTLPREISRQLLTGLVLLLLSIIAPSASWAQHKITAKQRGEKMQPLDSVRLGYRFKAGQSVTYRAISRDSIFLY